MKARLARIGILGIIVFSLILAVAMPVGAQVTGVTNIPADPTAGATTNHTIAFTTGVALVLAEADQIIITFPSGFNASGAGVDAATLTPSTTDPTLASATTTVVTLNVAADEPAGAFSVVLTGIDNTQTAGSYTVSVATTKEIAAVDSASFDIDPGTAASFRVVTENGGTETAGATFSVTLTALDAYGNTATSYTGISPTITFTSTATNAPDDTAPIIPATEGITFNNGNGPSSIGFTLFDAGETPTITASDGSISGISAAITVNPAAIDHYTVTSISYTPSVNAAFTVTVTAYDQYGNRVTTDSTTEVTMSSSSITMRFNSNGNLTFGEVGDERKTLSAGTFNIQAKDTVSGTGVTIIATDGNGKMGTSLSYTINPQADTTRPTLQSITWTDVNDSDTIDAGDTLRFNFSEAMDTTTITAANIETTLPTTPDHSYGTLTAANLSWNTAKDQLTVTLKTGETIVGGETVNPSNAVKDVAGNLDNTTAPGPTIPTAETTRPTLQSITWTDVNDSDTIDAGDTLRFNFSEAMDTTTITAANIETTLPTTPDHSYGTLTTANLSWNTAKDQLTVTLKTGETIVGGETVNPSNAVKDVAGNLDNTTAPGPAIPGPTPTPTPTPSPTPTGTAGTAESWVRTEDGRITVHLPAGAFASVTNVSIEPSATCPEAPEDFTLGETCFSITAEAELLRSIDVCVRYTDADVAAADGDPQKLRLAVYDETEAEWDVLSTDIDERTQTACARVDHLSDFALLVGPGPPGFFSTDWWTVWWHVLPFAAGLAIVIAVGVWLWLRYRFYY